MTSVSVKLYNVFFKLLLRHKLQALLHLAQAQPTHFGITCRPDESTAPDNPTFGPDGVAIKDIHVDPLSSLSLRLFFPDTSLARRSNGHAPDDTPTIGHPTTGSPTYSSPRACRRSAGSRNLPVILQFHGGAFVAGSNTFAANDFFCRRISKLLDVIVVAVGHRLAPESRYPATFDDGVKLLNWLGKHAYLAECSKSLGS